MKAPTIEVSEDNNASSRCPPITMNFSIASSNALLDVLNRLQLSLCRKYGVVCEENSTMVYGWKVFIMWWVYKLKGT
jgi:hypothetical protein